MLVAPALPAAADPLFSITGGAADGDLQTPDDFAALLLGDGVDLVGSATINGEAAPDVKVLGSFGRFEHASDHVGLDRGLIITANADAASFATNTIKSTVTTSRDDPDLEALALAAGLCNPSFYPCVNNATSLEFSVVPTDRYLKFEYVLGVTEYGNYSELKGWSGAVFSYPDGFGLFVGGRDISDNCAVVPGTDTYLTMRTAGIVSPDGGRTAALTNLAARVADLDPAPTSPPGIAYQTTDDDTWAVRFVTVPLTCVVDVTAEQTAGLPVDVKIVVADANDAAVPPAVFLAGESVRFDDHDTPVPASDNADLSSFTVGGATLTPPFDPDVTDYTTTVPASVHQLDLTVAADDGDAATVTVDGNPVAADGSYTLELDAETTDATIVVTAENGTTRTYTIAVTRTALVEPPTVDGTATDGQTLTVTTGVWEDGDTYDLDVRWLTCDNTGGGCVDTGRTGDTYLLDDSDIGATLRAQVTASSTTSDFVETVETAATAPVAPKTVEPGSPAVTGTAYIGQTLTAQPGTWDGSGEVTFAYQWQRCAEHDDGCAAVDDATASTYDITGDDDGSWLRVAVTGTPAAGDPATAISDTVGPVTAAPKTPPSTITPPDPDPQPTPPQPRPEPGDTGQLARPRTGTGQVTVGTETDGTAVIETRPNQTTVTGNGYQIEVRTVDGSGQTEPAGQTGTMQIPQGSHVAVTVDGFAAQAAVRVWMFSQPRLLGEFHTDVDGALELALSAVLEDTSPCGHTLQVEGELLDGTPVTAAVGVWVTANPFPYADIDPQHVHAAGIGCLDSLGVVNGYADGSYHQHRTITRAQTATVLARMLELDTDDTDDSYDDVAGVHAGAIGAVTRHGIVTGAADRQFDPHGLLTRGQAAAVLAAAAGLHPTDRATPFADANMSSHQSSIAALVEHGIISGYTDGSFRPHVPVTRGQFATMAAKTFGVQRGSNADR